MLTVAQQDLIKKITARYEPLVIGLFGSYARNESTPESDLDVLIEFGTKINLLEIIGLEQELSEALGVKVDLVTTRSLNKKILKHIEKDIIFLHDKRPHHIS